MPNDVTPLFLTRRSQPEHHWMVITLETTFDNHVVKRVRVNDDEVGG
jgi:hypothetical protein